MKNALILVLSASLLNVGLAATGMAQAITVRQWVDATGDHKVTARFIRLEGDLVVLETNARKTLKIPLDKLSEFDQEYMRSIGERIIDSKISDHKMKERILVKAKDIKSYYEAELENVKEEKIDIWIRTRLQILEKPATDDALKIDDSFMTDAELKSLVVESDVMVDRWLEHLKQANGDARSIHFKEAKKAITIARRVDAYSLRADFNLGLMNAFVVRDYEQAGKHFEECVRRGERYLAILNDVERQNLAAALNNLAIINARQSRLTDAKRFWSQAIEIDQNCASQVAANVARLKIYVGKSSNNVAFIRMDSKTKREYDPWFDELPKTPTPDSWTYIAFKRPYTAVEENLGFSLNDNSCIICMTAGTISCQNKSCRLGSVTKRRLVPVRDRSGKTVTMQSQEYTETCTACRGTNRNDCWGCIDGTQGF